MDFENVIERTQESEGRGAYVTVKRPASSPEASPRGLYLAELVGVARQCSNVTGSSCSARPPSSCWGRAFPPAGPSTTAHDRVVSADPADATPHVLDGKVETILPMGNRVYVGGSFTQVRNADDSRVIPRRGLFALDPATNRVDEAFVADFDVNPDRAQERGVKALAPAPGNNELFVGGEFGTLNGVAARKLVKLNAVNGARDPGFDVSVSAGGEGPGGPRPAAVPGRRLHHRRGPAPSRSGRRRRRHRRARPRRRRRLHLSPPGQRTPGRDDRSDARRHHAGGRRQLHRRRRAAPLAGRPASTSAPDRPGCSTGRPTASTTATRRASSAAPRPSTAIPATSTSRPTGPTSSWSPPAATPAEGRCATPPAGGRSQPGAPPSSRPGPTTAAATASPPWPSPAPRSTSAATPAG